MKKKFFLILYYSIFRWLPVSYRFGGGIAKRLRYLACSHIFKKCGANVNIERGAFFGNGSKVVVGDNSGIGINAVIPNDIIIGDNVLMGPEVYILSQNHNFDRIDIPIGKQGNKLPVHPCIIENDVWIGRQVTIMPGRVIKTGSVIAACTCLCKDFPAYSVVGGNPSRLIKSRLNN